MNTDDLRDYACCVAAMIKPKRILKANVRAALMALGLDWSDADAIIAEGLTCGLFAEVMVMGDPYLVGHP